MTAKTQKITDQTSQRVKEEFFKSLPPKQLAALVTAADVSNRIPLSAPIVASPPILPRRVTPLRANIAGSHPSRQDSPPEFVAPLPIRKTSADTLPPIEQSPEGTPKAEPLLPSAPGFGNQDDAEAKEIEKIIEALPYPNTGNHENINLWYGKVEECLREGRVDRARRIAKAAPHLDLRSHLLTDIARYLEKQDKLTDAISVAREVPEHFIRGDALQDLIEPLKRAGRNGTARIIEAEQPETYVKSKGHSNIDDSARRR